MTSAFADTGYYVALMAEADAHHAAATRWSEVATHVISTDFVFVELGNMLARSKWRIALPGLISKLRRDPSVEVVPASRSLMDQGWRLYEQRPDKDWSVVDCISFMVMRERGLKDALTTDHHFEQAGFRALLRH